jgi:hypothetical protein
MMALVNLLYYKRLSTLPEDWTDFNGTAAIRVSTDGNSFMAQIVATIQLQSSKFLLMGL